MKIRELFFKDISRPINGVIKADQRDAGSIWQELDEYVVTRQLTDYFRRFFDAYLAAADNPRDPVLAARMGVWVSGFFGSGKSHFIKILSYLLENQEACNPKTGEHRRAAAFFDEHKIKDTMLLADVQRATRGSADVILFNIDAKADSNSDRDVVLQVFLRVFNEKLGFSGDAPHIAEMERYLVAKGAYETFKEAFHEHNGSPWHDERDAVEFLRDDVVHALSVALKMTPESAAAWFDNARDSYRINIESFARLIREYLETKPAGHRVIFLVDEVGQFISGNTQLMLTLQTITEQLGTLCAGQAWVIVTSQEDIDAAIGEANKSKKEDFSKIQGRFHTRLSLASSNTDEVIGARLLTKREEAHQALRTVYERQSDVITNQLAFAGTSVNLRTYRDAAEFVTFYPFAPYQFTLLQKVFESIRRVGATGKHLSRGERSLLDAFQTAAKLNADKPVGTLVPLYDFYPAIESFLDTSVKRAIDQADDNDALDKPFDQQLLKALFLIRYVAEVLKPTVDNLATLCLEQIDADKLALRRHIQDSLERLEGQRLVSRNGDQWFFLTNEERDVAREIGRVDVSAVEKARMLGELLFGEVLRDQTRVRHKDSKGDYDFNRLLDGAPYRQALHELTLEIVTPLGDEYEQLTEPRCILRSAEGHGRVLVRLDEGERLDVELTLYLQIEKYVEMPRASATPSFEKIKQDRKEENRQRHDRLVEQLTTLLLAGDCYAKGQRLTPKANNPGSLLDELVNYLVTNTYNKLPLLKQPTPDPLAEIRAVLAVDAVAQRGLALPGEGANPQAMAEVREYLNLAAKDKRVLLSDVVERFTAIPYGWKPEWEVVLLVARLFMSGELKLGFEGADLDSKSALEPLTKQVRFKQVSILKRKQADAGSLRRARDLYKDLFSALAREDEDGLVSDWREQLGQWAQQLKLHAAQATQKHHPGKDRFDTLLARIAKQQAVRDACEYVEALNRDRDGWRDAGEDLADLCDFYERQLPTWRRMLEALALFEDNREVLVKDAKAGAALRELEALRDSQAPFPKISSIAALVATVQAVNDAQAGERRTEALLSIDQRIDVVQAELDAAGASAELRNRALQPLQALKAKVAGEARIPQIVYLEGRANALLDTAVETIAEAIEAARKAQAAQTAGSSGSSTDTTAINTHDGSAAVKPPPVANPGAAKPKPVQAVRAANFCAKSYLENEAEVDAYLQRLKTKVMEMLKAGQRVRIE